MGLREYNNINNPHMNNEAYISTMGTVDYEKIKAFKGSCYLKTNANAGVGFMIPLSGEQQLFTPIRAEAGAGVTAGYSPKEHPLIYPRTDAQISNEPLSTQKDHGTIGIVGVAIGNEIPIIKRDKINVILFMETQLIKPFGSYQLGNPLPDQPGKFDFNHKMVDFKLQFNF